MSDARRRPLKVGLYIANGDGYMSGSINRWADVLAMATAAEAAGFDSVWVADHMIFRFPGDEEAQSRWECWSLLAGLAVATSRVQIGPLVSCMSFRNPGLLAKIAETVDEMSNGRLILAVGAGWHEPEYTGFGFPFDHRASRFEEGYAMLYELLRTGRSDFSGDYYRATDGELRPRGPRPNKIPILVGTNGERLLRTAARYADGWNTTWIADPSELIPLRAAVDAACAEVGRDPATLGRSACVYLDLPNPIGRFGGHRPEFVPPPAREAAGNADALRAYAAAGLDHVMLWLDPATPEAVRAFGETLAILDRDG
jgi:alkanesulfonate monooxygenase SsuD/methylene tetrahydromethanopterin reductase-like flavin-dependent oxidoreductase (luciferase family)